MPIIDNAKSMNFTPHLQRIDSCSSAEIRTNIMKGNKNAPSRATLVRKKTNKPKRNIHWNEEVIVRCIEHVNDMSDEQIHSVWWTREDFQSFKAGFAVTVRMVITGAYEKDCDQHCVRGLEFRTREGALRRKNNKLTSIFAVLDEQERQRVEGIYCPEDISAAYVESNLTCRMAALKMGKKDEQECRRISLAKDSLVMMTKKEKKEASTKKGRLQRLFSKRKQGKDILGLESEISK